MKYTTDLWFASYLISRGCPVVGFKLVGARRGSYGFAIDGDQWQQLKLEFMQSDVSKIKQIQQELKDLLY